MPPRAAWAMRRGIRSFGVGRRLARILASVILPAASACSGAAAPVVTRDASGDSAGDAKQFEDSATGAAGEASAPKDGSRYEDAGSGSLGETGADGPLDGDLDRDSTAPRADDAEALDAPGDQALDAVVDQTPDSAVDRALDAVADRVGDRVEAGGGCPVGLRSISQFPTGNSPTAPVLVDANGDGKLDLLFADLADAQIEIWIGDGHGAFAPPLRYATGMAPVSIAVGDLNGDLAPDLVVANDQSAQPISVLLADGQGGFGAPFAVMEGSVPVAVALGDANGDGKLDVLVGNGSSHDVSVLFGDGTGAFLTPQSWGSITPATPDTLKVADLNGDGRLDLLVGTRAAGGVTVLLGAPGGTFPSQSTYFSYFGPPSLALGDLNADGNIDIALPNPTTYVVMTALGAGDGTFLPRVSYPLDVQPVSVALGDFNGDGVPDLAVGTSLTESRATAKRAYLLLGLGDGTFGAPTGFDVGLGPGTVAAGDLDGDGVAELAVANRGSNTMSILAFTPCGGTPGTAVQSACVQGAPCTGNVALTCAGGAPGLDTCTQGCDCSGGAIYCNTGCQ